MELTRQMFFITDFSNLHDLPPVRTQPSFVSIEDFLVFETSTAFHHFYTLWNIFAITHLLAISHEKYVVEGYLKDTLKEHCFYSNSLQCKHNINMNIFSHFDSQTSFTFFVL